MEGFYPERVRQDLKWNRVLNLQGTSGGNISPDLLTELLISEFKGDSHTCTSAQPIRWKEDSDPSLMEK